MRKPKLILGILMHDAGRQFGCYGAADASTPNIDQMAGEGVLFANHFSTGTVCVPSRASILTGKYLHNAETCFYRSNVETLPRLLRRAGFTSIRCGFAEEKEYRSIAGGPYPYGDADCSGCRLLGYDRSITNSASASDVVDTVISLLKDRTDDAPLYIAAAFSEAHAPLNHPITESDIDRAVIPPLLPQVPDVRPARTFLARLAKSISAADTAIGRLTACIRSLGLFEDTLLYFSCDHGIDLPRAKQSAYDSGIGVPLIFWGGCLPESGIVAHGLSSHVDLMPTLCEWVGIQPPPDCCGISQIPQLEGRPGGRNACFAEVSFDNTDAPVRAIRTKNRKLILNMNPGLPAATGNTFTEMVGCDVLTPIYCTPRPYEEFYDLEKDPCELNNLAGSPDYAEEHQALKARLFAELARTNDRILCADSPYAHPDTDHAIAMWHKLPDGSFVLQPQ